MHAGRNHGRLGAAPFGRLPGRTSLFRFAGGALGCAMVTNGRRGVKVLRTSRTPMRRSCENRTPGRLLDAYRRVMIRPVDTQEEVRNMAPQLVQRAVQAVTVGGMLAEERLRSGVTFFPMGERFTTDPY